MLKVIRVTNYALIREAEIEFAAGLNLLTGETGAGKSLLIGALSAILGDKAPVDFLRSGADKGFIEGEFVLSHDSPLHAILKAELEDSNILIVRREIHRNGRSRCFINDSPTSAKKLNEVGALLVELCGQHEHQTLLKSENHLDYLDKFGDLLHLRSQVSSLYARYKALSSKLQRLKTTQANRLARYERSQFEIKEIEAVNPSLEEEEELLNEEKALEHGESILQFCHQAEEYLTAQSGSAAELLAELLADLENIASFAPQLMSIQSDLQSAAASIEEAVRSIVGFRSKFDFSPERLEAIRERLGALSALKRKYGGSIETVIDHLERLKKELESFVSIESEIETTRDELKSALESLIEKSIELSHSRIEIAPRLEAEMQMVMFELGFKHADFQVRLGLNEGDDAEVEGSKVQLQPSGLDSCEFYIRTNPGEGALPLKSTASGGEISRIMLALKSVIAGRDNPSTIVFDEIDNGISGAIARKVGLKLFNTSKSQQILVITHLPQIASLPGRHFSVVKVELDGRAVSRFIPLEEKARVDEVAKLLTTGETQGKEREFAKELLSAKDIE